MEKNIPNQTRLTTGNFYENSFIRDFPLGSYFINEFNKIPKILNTDTRIDEKIIDWFEGKQPSTENLVVYIWKQIANKIPNPAYLHSIKLRETPTIYTEYYGPEGE